MCEIAKSFDDLTIREYNRDRTCIDFSTENEAHELMKILHTSDWHLGKSLYEFSLLQDQQYMIEQLLLLLEKEGVEAVIIAGDIYDRPIPPARAVQLYDYFLAQAVGRLGISVLAISGNHDSPSRLEFGSGFYAASGYHICGSIAADVCIHRVTLADRFGDIHFYLLPFLHPADLRALFPDEQIKTYDDTYRILLEKNNPALDLSQRNILIAHGFFSSIGQNSTDKSLLTSDSEINIGGMDIADSTYFSAFDYTALGHLHAPQRAGSDRIRYSGSPLKYSMSEEKQKKSFTLIEAGEKGDMAITNLYITPLRDVRTVRGTLDQLLEPSFHENKAFGDYIFAELCDTQVLYPMEKLRKLFPNLLGLRFVENSDISFAQVQVGTAAPKLSPYEMFLRFYRESKGYDLSSEGMQYLSEVVEQINRREEYL